MSITPHAQITSLVVGRDNGDIALCLGGSLSPVSSPFKGDKDIYLSRRTGAEFRWKNISLVNSTADNVAEWQLHVDMRS